MSSQIVDFLSSRLRRRIHELKEPPPDDAEIEQLIASPRAPDHGRLSPWRFLLYRGEAQESANARGAGRKGRPLSDGRRQQEMARFARAPLHRRRFQSKDHPKIPQWEMFLAGSAAMNLVLPPTRSATAPTGSPTGTDTEEGGAFSLALHERVVGFVHIGTFAGAPKRPRRRRRDRSDYRGPWEG